MCVGGGRGRGVDNFVNVRILKVHFYLAHVYGFIVLGQILFFSNLVALVEAIRI